MKFHLTLLSPIFLLLGLSQFTNAAWAQVEYTQISRLPALTSPLDPSTQKLLDETRSKGGQIINLHLTYAHAPKIGAANLTMAYALRFDSISPRVLREVAIIRTAQLMESKYEINQHYPLGLICGLSKEQINHMPVWREHGDMFDARQKAVMAYTEAMLGNKGEVDDATYQTLSNLFSSREIVELTMAISAYTSTALFTKALKTQIEPDGRFAAVGKC
jgi:alkylhydroperoxidase family enzyme